MFGTTNFNFPNQLGAFGLASKPIGIANALPEMQTFNNAQQPQAFMNQPAQPFFNQQAFAQQAIKPTFGFPSMQGLALPSATTPVITQQQVLSTHLHKAPLTLPTAQFQSNAPTSLLNLNATAAPLAMIPQQAPASTLWAAPQQPIATHGHAHAHLQAHVQIHAPAHTTGPLPANAGDINLQPLDLTKQQSHAVVHRAKAAAAAALAPLADLERPPTAPEVGASVALLYHVLHVPPQSFTGGVLAATDALINGPIGYEEQYGDAPMHPLPGGLWATLAEALADEAADRMLGVQINEIEYEASSGDEAAHSRDAAAVMGHAAAAAARARGVPMPTSTTTINPAAGKRSEPKVETTTTIETHKFIGKATHHHPRKRTRGAHGRKACPTDPLCPQGIVAILRQQKVTNTEEPATITRTTLERAEAERGCEAPLPREHIHSTKVVDVINVKLLMSAPEALAEWFESTALVAMSDAAVNWPHIEMAVPHTSTHVDVAHLNIHGVRGAHADISLPHSTTHFDTRAVPLPVPVATLHVDRPAPHVDVATVVPAKDVARVDQHGDVAITHVPAHVDVAHVQRATTGQRAFIGHVAGMTA